MEIPRHWRLSHQRYRLVGEMCSCGARLFPPRDVCPACQSLMQTPYTFSGRSELYAFVQVQDALAGAPFRPIIVAA